MCEVIERFLDVKVVSYDACPRLGPRLLATGI